MKRFTSKLTNAVDTANWGRVPLTHKGNNTTNYLITPDIFKRECAEYDNGTLPFEHERYLGEL